jgi:hypothetical protein
MKKDHCRDYVVNMFRFYAKVGEPDRAQIRNLKTQFSAAAILDLYAVDNTLRVFSERERSDVIRAIREIYFVCPSRELRKNEISNRVTRFSVANNMDERSVYRRLELARRICAEKRNLNI